MPKFRVWDPTVTDEIDALRANDKWACHEAFSHRHAAEDFANAVCLDNCDHLAADCFVVHVRDHETYALTIVAMALEWDPRAVSDDATEVSEADDAFRQAASHLEYTIGAVGEETYHD